MAVDDATRLAYDEVLPDEKQEARMGFLLRAVAWFNGHGIHCCRVLSDNGSARLTIKALEADLRGPWADTQTHQTVHPTDEWQS